MLFSGICPTSHHFGIPGVLGQLWHVRFQLSNSGNTGSKVHCGSFIYMCQYYHYIVVRRDVWLLRLS